MWEYFAPIIAVLNRVLCPKSAKGKNIENSGVVGIMIQNKAGMFARAETKVEVNIDKLIVHTSEINADEPLPDGTRVAYHDILSKRVVIGTKAGPVTIDLAGSLADQERDIDEKLAVFQKHNMLAPLYDRDKMELLEDKSGEQE